MSQISATGKAPLVVNMYGSIFWMAFAANLFLVTANTMTYRFAEFVRYLGGTEEVTGRIIGIGLVGSLIWRLFLGQAMDRFGIRAVWLVSTVAYLIGSTLIAMTDAVGPTLFVARILFSIGMASMFTTALSHVQGLAPPHRRTEIIASYGSAGFIGMVIGSLLGDQIFQSFPDGHILFKVLFGVTTALGAGHGLLGYVVTRGQKHIRPAATPAVHQLYVRYWPSHVLIVTLMMGLVFAVTTIFLTRYATTLGLSGIKTFFSAYALTAFLMRVFTRRWSESTSRYRLMTYGLASHAVGQVLLLFVTQEWQFLPAAICFGFGHAILFPCIVSLGAGAFPTQYRGTGTTLCLAAIDLGTMLTAPMIGWMIDETGFRMMLITATAVLTGVTVYYTFATWNLVDDEVVVASQTTLTKVAPTPVSTRRRERTLRRASRDRRSVAT